MNYRLLSIEDAPEYLEHLNAVYDTKGLLSVKDREWVSSQKEIHARLEVVQSVISGPYQEKIWVAEEDGRIVDSMRTQTWQFIPAYTIHNFKSTRTGAFNPLTSLFPLWDFMMSQFEAQGFYSAYFARPLRWLNKRKTVPFHEHPPMNRYHATFEQVVKSGAVTEFLKFRSLLPEPMPVNMVIVSLHLRQELRRFDNQTMEEFL